MSGGMFDDPNRQAVGLDPAWVEGTGGSPGEVTPQATEQLTKAQLLEQAQQLGLDVTEQNTKAELREAIDQA